MDTLAQDYPPQPDRRTSSGYRARVAANLLYRFWLETCDNALAPEAVNVRAPAADSSALT